MITGPRQDRLVGVDVARCIALLGMVSTHVLLDFTPEGELTFHQWLAGGRASSLFAVLAGVSVALMTGGRHPFEGEDRWRASAGLVIRALMIAVLAGALVVPTPTGDELAGAAESFYASRPDAVRRIIVTPASSGLSSFSDAFKLWRD